jgi:hypothetical protein
MPPLPLDIYDNEPWSDMAIADLKQQVAAGVTLEEAAGFLCRSGDPLAVAKKAKELGLTWQRGGVRRKPKRGKG